MKTIKIIEKLFKVTFPKLTPIVSVDNGEYSIHIKEEFVVVYDPNTFTPVYKFFIDEGRVETLFVESLDLNFYRVFDNFIPQIKIKMYWKKKGVKEYNYIYRDSEITPVAAVSGATFICI